MSEQTLGQGDALIIVDVQKDFCPGGLLPVPQGDQVVPVINRWINHAHAAGTPVVASRDWHPKRHLSFESEGGTWPEHCLQDTDGASFHPDLQLPDDVIKVSKGVRFDKDQYSVFDDTGLGDFLRRYQVHRLWMAGLAQDVCVRASALAGCDEGFAVHVIMDGTKPIDVAEGRRTLQELAAAGVMLETGSG
jgi:nicotinamidase/pyrazinamidase